MAFSTLEKVVGSLLILLTAFQLIYLMHSKQKLVLVPHYFGSGSSNTNDSGVLLNPNLVALPSNSHSRLPDSNIIITHLSNMDNASSDGAPHFDRSVCKAGFVFIKTHKTGSTTLSAILNSYGYQHQFSFLLNKNNPPSGNFNFLRLTAKSMRGALYPPVKVKTGDWNRYQYQASAIHMIYDRPLLEAFLPNSRYLTVLRDPVEQFISSFHYFKIARRLWPSQKRLSLGQALDLFLKNSTSYQSKLKDVWNFIHNSQLFDLGLDHKYHSDRLKVEQKLGRLQTELDLVLITERFDESLLLLRKLMCWDWQDVTYISKNLSPTRPVISDQTRKEIQQFVSADIMLYKKFSAKLSQELDDYGAENLRLDLSHFRASLTQTFKDCVQSQEVHEYEGIQHIEYNLKPKASAKCKSLLLNNNNIIRNIMNSQAPESKPKPRVAVKRYRPVVRRVVRRRRG